MGLISSKNIVCLDFLKIFYWGKNDKIFFVLNGYGLCYLDFFCCFHSVLKGKYKHF